MSLKLVTLALMSICITLNKSVAITKPGGVTGTADVNTGSYEMSTNAPPGMEWSKVSNTSAEELTTSGIFNQTYALNGIMSVATNNNVTDNATASTDGEKETWLVIFDHFQAASCGIGIVANLTAAFVLLRVREGFSKALLILLKHQAFLDALACAFTMIIILQPYMWSTGSYYVDAIICYGWHSQVRLAFDYVIFSA